MAGRNGDVEQNVALAGGLDTNTDPKAIPDYRHVRSQNLFPSTGGILWKRPGLTVSSFVNSLYISTVKFAQSPLHLFPAHPRSGYGYLSYGLFTRIDTGTVQLIMRASSLDNDLNGDSAIKNSTLDSSVNAADVTPLCFCNYDGHTLFTGKWPQPGAGAPVGLGGLTNDIDPTTGLSVGYQLHNDLSFTSGGQEQSIPVRPLICCSYKGRMRYFNFGPGMENWMISADATSGAPGVTPNYLVVGSDVLSPNGRYVAFNEVDGEYITAAFEAQLQAVGSPIESCLVVLTNKSMLIGTGDYSDSDEDPEAFMVWSKVQYEVGCVHQNTVAKTPYGYIWASASDVWLLNGNLPVKIGTSITKELQATPEQPRQHWTAAYCNDPGVYVLDVIVNQGSDDRFLQHAQYWLQLNDAMPPRSADQARWFGPMVVLTDNGAAIADLTATYHSGVSQSVDGKTLVKLVCAPGYGGTISDVWGTSLVSITSSDGNVDDYPFVYVPAAIDWEPETDYDVGDVVKGTFGKFDGHFYVCREAPEGDISGATEPLWTPAGITDGGIEWVAIETDIGAEMVKARAINYSDASQLLNLTQFRSKEYALENPTVDKMLKKVDLVAFSSVPQELDVSAISNQGAKNQTIGTPLFGQSEALRAGVSELDSALISDNEFESRAARPGPATGLIRSKFLQVDIADTGQIVIDETCNKLCFGLWDGSVMLIAQAELTLDSTGVRTFGSMHELTAALVTAMNIATPNWTYTNTAIENLNWSTNPPYGTAWPYTNNFAAVFTSTGPNIVVHLFYGNTDGMDLSALVDALQPDLSSGGSAPSTEPAAGPFDFAKSKKLMALLGFGTETVVGTNDLAERLAVGSNEVFYQIGLNAGGASTDTVYGTTQVADKRSSKIALANARVSGRLTSTSALQYRTR